MKKEYKDMKHNYVYAYLSNHNTCYVINYTENFVVNQFLDMFIELKGITKHRRHNNDPRAWMETCFECDKEFFDMLHTETMKRAFRRMKTELVFEYPFWEEPHKTFFLKFIYPISRKLNWRARF